MLQSGTAQSEPVTIGVVAKIVARVTVTQTNVVRITVVSVIFFRPNICTTTDAKGTL